MEKLERNGKVAVLYSSGYGAGWYSWNEGYPQILFDPELVELAEKEQELPYPEITLAKRAQEKYPDIYTGGADCGLDIKWIPKGTRFYIHEYDGNEHVRIIDENFGHIA